ncbi:ABC transporter ATP-binding protein [Anaeromicropila populeti]|uniref:ABC-2 type transport system ATP-binding protein n=1 Tax=Anaeromicropila populeti TaxID=37658 RepID=A0A1I6LJD6_9FIRM|nr:ABC transporter ATP-binding protein [Anaeromicropila populeti]SFS03569.1 ABC-2 type transport system ATP-binding protein [Anaeromicropila populeti]
MIEAIAVSKSFDDIKAIDSVTASIKEGSVYGLVGTNGAGKSTFLRMVCGIYKPDRGNVIVDNSEVYENESIKKQIFYISDDQFFFSNATPDDMKKYYQVMYDTFDGERFDKLIKQFELNPKRKINTFSKGMKKQVSIICGLCATTKYLLCDETFDGLDPVMRQAVKSILIGEIMERNMTPIIASHSLRELEDICEHVGLLHKGGILFSRDLDDMKLNIHKLQCVFASEESEKQVLSQLQVMHYDKKGSICYLTVRGELDQISQCMESVNPVFYESVQLSLEEIFISETEVLGYDIKKLIF